MCPVSVVPPEGLVSMAVFGQFCETVWAIVYMDLRKLRRDPTELVTRMVQPVLWLLLFGQVMQRVRGVAPGGIPYMQYVAPGILAQSVLFTAIFAGITTIFERDLGITHKLLVSPNSRFSLVCGKALCAGLRALVQVVVLQGLLMALGVWRPHNWWVIPSVAVVVVLGAMLFSTLSLIVACLLKSRDRLMGFGQMITMPLFFASNAIYPLDLMPGWLQHVARWNPLTYQVDALRTLMLGAWMARRPLALDLLVLTAVTLVLLAIAARVYGRVVR